MKHHFCSREESRMRFSRRSGEGRRCRFHRRQGVQRHQQRWARFRDVTAFIDHQRQQRRNYGSFCEDGRASPGQGPLAIEEHLHFTHFSFMLNQLVTFSFVKSRKDQRRGSNERRKVMLSSLTGVGGKTSEMGKILGRRCIH